MSWFKKIVTRILGDEAEETPGKNQTYNEYEEDQPYQSYDQFEENNSEDYYNENEYDYTAYRDEMIETEQSQEPHPSFNFPMVSDEYVKESNEEEAEDYNIPSAETSGHFEQPRQQTKIHSTWQDRQQSTVRPKDYSPFSREPKGLKGVVEKQSRENYNPFRSSNSKPIKPAHEPYKQEMKYEKKAFKQETKYEKKAIYPSQEKEINKDREKEKADTKQVDYPVKKKFVPTDVPSPVYGFKRPKRPKDIQKLIDEKEKKAKEPLPKTTEALIDSHMNKQKAIENETTKADLPASGSVIKPELPKNLDKGIEEQVGQVPNNTSQHIVEEKTKIQQSPTLEKLSAKSESEHMVVETNRSGEEDHEHEDECNAIVQEPIHDEKAQVIETNVEIAADVIEELEEQKVIEEQEVTAELEELEELEEFEVTEIPEETVQNKTSGSKIPFNVVMLKTDKKKLDPFSNIDISWSGKKLPIKLPVVEEITNPVNDETVQEIETLNQEEATEAISVTVEEHELLEVQKAELETVQAFEGEIPENDEAEIPNATEHSGSRVPFNVVMLKTDKEKLNPYSNIETPLRNKTSFSTPSKQEAVQPKEVPAASMPNQSEIEEEIQEEIIEKSPEVLLESHSAQINTETASIEDKKEQVEYKPSTVNEHLDEAIAYLKPPEEQTEDFGWMDAQGEKLIEALSYFQIDGEIVQIVQGPAVTQFEITVGHGVKVSKIRNLADDLKLALAARDIRIQAPIPGKSSIGIEIPNRASRAVRLTEVVKHSSFINSDSPLEAALGLDLTGEPMTIDLRKMPHGMIAGATGSGKSVCINSLLVSLLLKASPQDVKLMLIDPKMVELAPFNHIPHLVSPVITDVKAATAALKWAVEEMERRYQLFAHAGARDITRYNKMVEADRKFSLKMPYLVIVIDELADLMMMSPQEVEESICRIAQKARACGIHLVLATQRPSVDVITGLIKSNIPTRIAFSVSSHVDSRTILDSQGAERLLGRGDMLYLGNGMSAPVRVQGTFVTDDEIEEVTSYVRSLGEPDYLFQQEELLKKVDSIEEQDELFEEACRFICREGTVSVSSLQRKYRIGYNRAARLVDMMEAQGFISESKGTKPRDVFLTEQDLENIFNGSHV